VEVQEEEVDNFQQSVFANLQSMTSMLQEMRKSQSYQEEDIRSLSNKLENVAGRIGQEQQQQQQQQQQQMQRQQQIMQRQMTRPRKKKVEDNNDRRTKSFGKSLDGEFHRKIKNVMRYLTCGRVSRTWIRGPATNEMMIGLVVSVAAAELDSAVVVAAAAAALHYCYCY